MVAVVAIVMVVLLGMVALTLDFGQKVNARRNVQAAVDIGLLSGAQEVSVSRAAASERIAAEIRKNLDLDFTDSEWSEMWRMANCVDPDRLEVRGTVGAAPTDCISFDDTGQVRVRMPDVVIPTLFGGIFGVDQLRVSAEAVALVGQGAGIGNLAPFAVVAGASDGSLICLRSSSGGRAEPPCTGARSGNFGALDVSIYGDPAFNTHNIACNTNRNDTFTINLAVGVDHLVRVHTGGAGVTDSCAKPFGPDQFHTLTGLGNGLWEGLVSGKSIQGTHFPGRLTNHAPGAPTITVRQGASAHVIDNTPIWAYIPTGLAPDEAPRSCHRETFEALEFTAATANIETCLNDYQQAIASGANHVPLFTVDANGDGELDIIANPRFIVVPQLHETELPRGRKVVRVAGFRAVWMQGLYFPSGPRLVVTEPGDPTDRVIVPNGGSPLGQVTGWLLPDTTLGSIVELDDAAGGEVTGSAPIELLE